MSIGWVIPRLPRRKGCNNPNERLQKIAEPKNMAIKLPTFDHLMKPLVRALQALGGSGSIQEIYDKVVELEKFPEAVLSQLHDSEKSNQTEVAYRLAWARTYLKKYGLLENSARGIWSLNQKAKEGRVLDPQKVVQFVRSLDKKEKRARPPGRPARMILPLPRLQKSRSGSKSYTSSSLKI